MVMNLFHQLGHTCHEQGIDVNQLQHALQSAFLAEKAGCTAELITACLLHDIGQLVMGDSVDAPNYMHVDEEHEVVGFKFLASLFPETVTYPVLHHVAAKRYLAADPAYYEILSETSKISLGLQGGRFTPAEAATWIAQPYAQDGIRLRQFDEYAKVEGVDTPPLAHFRKYIVQAAQGYSPAAACACACAPATSETTATPIAGGVEVTPCVGPTAIST